MKDINSRFVIANQVTADRIGVASPQDLIGKTDLELLPHDIAQKFYDDEQRIVRTGESLTDMEEIAWGIKQAISTTKVPLRNDRNEIFGVAGISRDITERKLAETLRAGQAQDPRNDRDERAARQGARTSVHLLESQLKGIFGPVLLLDETGTRFNEWRRAEPAGGLHQGYRRRAHRPQNGPVRHGGLSAATRNRRGHHADPL